MALFRDNQLTPEEAAKYRAVREQVDEELPELIARHHERTAAGEQVTALVDQLKTARSDQGMSLDDVAAATGIDRDVLADLESGEKANANVETLVRYAEAVGRRLAVSLTDA